MTQRGQPRPNRWWRGSTNLIKVNVSSQAICAVAEVIEGRFSHHNRGPQIDKGECQNCSSWSRRLRESEARKDFRWRWRQVTSVLLGLTLHFDLRRSLPLTCGTDEQCFNVALLWPLFRTSLLALGTPNINLSARVCATEFDTVSSLTQVSPGPNCHEWRGSSSPRLSCSGSWRAIQSWQSYSCVLVQSYWDFASAILKSRSSRKSFKRKQEKSLSALNQTWTFPALSAK